MDEAIEISANIFLSVNGEELHLSASENKIVVTIPCFRSGLRALLNIDKHHSPFLRSNALNDILKKHGWTVYAHSGKTRLAILGVRGRRGLMAALLYFSRLCRLAGAI